MTRRRWILVSIVAGIVFFVLASYRVGAREPGWNLWCIVVFYPLQFLVLGILERGWEPLNASGGGTAEVSAHAPIAGYVTRIVSPSNPTR